MIIVFKKYILDLLPGLACLADSFRHGHLGSSHLHHSLSLSLDQGFVLSNISLKTSYPGALWEIET